MAPYIIVSKLNILKIINIYLNRISVKSQIISPWNIKWQKYTNTADKRPFGYISNGCTLVMYVCFIYKKYTI